MVCARGVGVARDRLLLGDGDGIGGIGLNESMIKWRRFCIR